MKLWKYMLGAASAIFALTSSRQALAYDYTNIDVPVLIEYYQNNGTNPQLLIQMSGPINYYGQMDAPAGCTGGTIFANSIDTVKAWQSLATSALLAGKRIQIAYLTCNGFRYIAAVDLLR